MKLIVIGGVAAGMSAASKLRRMDDKAQITVYEKGNHLSYAACGLPYLVSGVADNPGKLIIRSQEKFEAAGIKTLLNHEIIQLIPERQEIIARDLNTGNTFSDTYDKLMIAVGAYPVIPPVKGTDLKGVITMRSLEDGLAVREMITDQVEDVVIVGGGYIGIEMAEAMAELKKRVTVIEMADRILTPFDEEIGSLVVPELEQHGVTLNLGEKLLEIKGNNHVESIVTTTAQYKADLVVLALGVRPATAWLADSGIHLAGNGAIIVDREMRTNLDHVYAAGDCAFVYHYLKLENDYIPLGTNANKCGKIAGENISGKQIQYEGTLGSAAIKVFDLEIARTGLSEIDARKLNLNYDTVVVNTIDHARYYPGSAPIRIKLIYEKGTKRILGAQAAGKKGVVLRIDVFAAAIAGNLNTDQLGMTDFCYTPACSTVWDAVNIACNAAK